MKFLITKVDVVYNKHTNKLGSGLNFPGEVECWWFQHFYLAKKTDLLAKFLLKIVDFVVFCRPKFCRQIDKIFLSTNRQRQTTNAYSTLDSAVNSLVSDFFSTEKRPKYLRVPGRVPSEKTLITQCRPFERQKLQAS